MSSTSNQPLLHHNTSQSHNAKSHCKILLLTLSILALAVSTLLLLLPKYLTTSSNDDYLSSSSPSYICRLALHPNDCHKLASQAVTIGANPPDAALFLRKILIKKANRISKAKLQTEKLKEGGPLADCLYLLDRSIDLVLDSIKALEQSPSDLAGVHAWLSAVLTNHVTCLDGLDPLGRESIGAVLEDLISWGSASLGMFAAVTGAPHREEFRGGMPAWLTAADRKLLESRAGSIKADVVVAKDGSGDYKKLEDAIAGAPEKSMKRYVIHVKKGTYRVEYLQVTKNKWNLTIVGDGMDCTIITGSRYNNKTAFVSTFNSSTLAAVGDGVILQDLQIRNTAGPEKYQAVALRVGADRAVINRCLLDAFQDTLYPHSLRQFYRDSYITGTIDFVFGNAAVVLQRCQLVARKPMKGQKNMVTAQSRTDPNQNTGTSIQDCDIIASDDLEPEKSSFPTFLGRPWQNFSRTVVMQSKIGDHVDPAGWHEWSGDTKHYLDTLYYGEYMNYGAGAGTSERVTWKGYHVITDAAVAMNFTVRKLIQGGEWIAAAGVSFTEGL